MQLKQERVKRLVLIPSREQGFGDGGKETWALDARLDYSEASVIQAALDAFSTDGVLDDPESIRQGQLLETLSEAQANAALALEALYEDVQGNGEVYNFQPVGCDVTLTGKSERAQAVINVMAALSQGGRVAGCRMCNGTFWAGGRATAYCSSACRIVAANAARKKGQQ